MMSYRNRTFVFAWVVSLMVMVLSGCVSMPGSSRKQVLSDALFWFRQGGGLRVEEVLRAGNELFVRYQISQSDFDKSQEGYLKARWGDKRGKANDPFMTISVPVEMIDEDSWGNFDDGVTPVRLLNEQQSQEFRSDFIEAVLSSYGSKGLVIRGRSYHRRLVLSDDILREVRVKKRSLIKEEQEVSEEEFSAMLVTALKNYIQIIYPGERVEEVFMVFPFADQGHHPFIYIDLERCFSVALEVPSAARPHKEGFYDKGVRALDQIVWSSHVLGLIRRPVTSAFRLFAWTGGAVRDIIHPVKFYRLERINVPPVYETDPMDLDEWERHLDRIIGRSSRAGTLRLLLGGEEFFLRLKDAIQAAQDSIFVRIFIFDNDDYAVRIADLLKERARAGVKVRVLLDSIGILMGEGKTPAVLPDGFMPPRSMRTYLTQDAPIQARVRPSVWFKADHVKTIIIDRKISFVGGMNIGREYRHDWHDLMMEVRGPIVNDIVQDFRMAWGHAGAWGDLAYIKNLLFRYRQDLAEEKGYPVRLLFTRPNKPQIFKAQIAAIKNARKYIFISNAYFSDNAILYELIRARRRGVDVRVILPYQGNHGIMNANNIAKANVLFRHGIRVYFYPGMSHVKAAVYDGWVCVGSANFDKLSFRDNLELNLATSAPSVAQELLEKLFFPDFSRSKEMEAPIQTGLKEFLAELLAQQL